MDEPRHKVVFRVAQSDGSVDVETLWAFKVADDIYRLDNTPFYAYAVSWQDEVLAPADQDDGRPTFQRVVRKSGNRTVRVLFKPPVAPGNEGDKALRALVGLGCTYEGASRSYITLNVPAEVDLDIVRQRLIEMGLELEHADPTYEDLCGESGEPASGGRGQMGLTTAGL
jgi:hypothetical protein